MAKTGNLVVGQSGGPTMVINQSLIGVVMEAMKHPEIKNIYGAKHGVSGILKEDFYDFRKESKDNLELVATTPSAALGSNRHKPTKEDCEKIFEVFKKNDVRYFFYIGGNDSAEAADIINQIARERNYDLCVYHVPKTIDNDLRVTDHCPGYASAARYVAMSFMGNDLDNRSLPGVKIDIVMGRNAGWLTAASALAKQDEGDGPHLIYMPEKKTSLEKFVADIDAVYSKYGRCMVAVSEGMKLENGKLVLEDQITEKDSHGNIQLSGSGALGDFLSEYVKKHSKHQKLRVRSDTLGYAQRCFPMSVSEIDAMEARMVGEAAVRFAIEGAVDGSVGIFRTSNSPYKSEARRIELKDVAKVTKEMPLEFINKDGNWVTKECLEYLRPIVGPLPKVGKLNK